MHRRLPYALLPSLLLTVSNPAMAGGWLEEKAGQLGRAGGDVISLGQSGRDRDAEAARQELARAQAEAAAKETLRQKTIQGKRDELNALSDNLRDLEYFKTNVADLVIESGRLKSAADKELKSRSWMRNSVLPRFQKLIGLDREYSQELLATLRELTEANSPLAGNTFGMSQEAIFAMEKESMERTKAAIRRLDDAARAHDVELTTLIRSAMAGSDTKDAEFVVSALTKLDGKARAILKYAEVRSADKKQQIEIVTKELQKLGS